MASNQPTPQGNINAGQMPEPRTAPGTQFITQGPQIVKLSNGNFDKWLSELENALFIYNAEQHIEKPPAELEPAGASDDVIREVRRARMLALNMITQSISDELFRDCLANGYVSKDRDPHSLLKTVRMLLKQTPNHDKLIFHRRFKTLDFTNYNTLNDWWQNIKDVKARELTFYPKPDEDLWIRRIIVSLDDHPVGLRLSHEYGYNRLTYPMLVATITEAIDLEKKSQSSFIATTSRRRSKNKKQGDSQKPDQQSMIDCKMCNKEHRKDLPECEHYEHHHNGKCWLEFPERAPKGWKPPRLLPKKKKPKSSPTNQPSPTTFDFSGNMASMPYGQNNRQLDTNSRNRVMYDTGANRHIFNNKAWFSTLRPLDEPVRIDSSSGDKPELTLAGEVSFEVVCSDGKTTNIRIPNAILNENCPCNLVGGQLLKEATGIWHYGYDDRLFADDKVTEVAQLVNHNSHPYFIVKSSSLDQSPSAMLTINIDVMHKRLMHSGIERVRQLCRRQGINLRGKTLQCESCLKGKSTEMPHRGPPSRKMTAPLQLVYMDIMVVKPRSINGSDYCLHLIDCYTGYQWAIMLPNRKAQTVMTALTAWIRAMEKQTGLQVLAFQMDNAKEFVGTTANDVFRKSGIVARFSPPETHEPMGRIERAHRTIAEAARTSLIEAKLPEKLWEHAMNAAIYLANRLPTKVNADDQAPRDKFAEYLGFEFPNDLSFIRIWGCKAFVHLKGNRQPDRARKMLPRAEEGRLVGWIGDAGHIYQIYLPHKNKVIRARDVRFIENAGVDDDKVEAVCEPIHDEGDQVPKVVNTGYWLSEVNPTRYPQQIRRNLTSERQDPAPRPLMKQTQAQITPSPDPDQEENQLLEELVERQFQQQCSPDPTPARVTFNPQNYIPGQVPPFFRDTAANTTSPDQLSEELSQLTISDTRMEGSPFNESQYIQTVQRAEVAAQRAEQAAQKAERVSRDVQQRRADTPPIPMAPRKTPFGEGYDDSPILMRIPQEPQPVLQAPPAMEPEPPQRRPRRQTAYKGTYNVDDLIQNNTFLAQRYTQLDTFVEPQAMALLADFEATGASTENIPETYGQAKKSQDWPQWKKAFEKEFHDLTRRDTWELVYPEPGDVILPGKWVLKVKHMLKISPRILFTDSANAMHTVLNPLCTARTRHIDIRYKWVIDMIKKKIFEIKHVEMDKMAADGLTKPLYQARYFWKEKHLGFVRMIGLSVI